METYGDAIRLLWEGNPWRRSFQKTKADTLKRRPVRELEVDCVVPYLHYNYCRPIDHVVVDSEPRCSNQAHMVDSREIKIITEQRRADMQKFQRRADASTRCLKLSGIVCVRVSLQSAQAARILGRVIEVTKRE